MLQTMFRQLARQIESKRKLTEETGFKNTLLKFFLFLSSIFHKLCAFVEANPVCLNDKYFISFSSQTNKKTNNSPI